VELTDKSTAVPSVSTSQDGQTFTRTVYKLVNDKLKLTAKNTAVKGKLDYLLERANQLNGPPLTQGYEDSGRGHYYVVEETTVVTLKVVS